MSGVSPAAALPRCVRVVHTDEQADAEVRRMAERNRTTNRRIERERHMIPTPFGIRGVISITSRCMHSSPLGASIIHPDHQTGRIVSLPRKFGLKLLFGRFPRL